MLLVMISSVGFLALYSAAEGSFDPWSKKQIIRFLISLVLLLFISLVDIRLWYKYSYHIFFLSLLLLIGVEIFGTFGLGAKRWIRIFSFSIQPSELIKVAIILSLAKYYNELRYDRIGWIRNTIIPTFIIIIPFFFVIIQPDLGTAAMILILGALIMFIAGVKIWKFITVLILSGISFPLIWNLILENYQKKRILSFLNPESDPLGSGYHLIQSKIALGSGGVYGKGYLKGSQAYLDFLPEKQTDFIFTLIGEEFGFIGTIFILILYIIIILICFYIAYRNFSIFGRLVSIGVGINIFLYVIFNTSMVTGLMPVVGVPLPLISYGGTVMLSTMISFGFLLNASIHEQQNKFNY